MVINQLKPLYRRCRDLWHHSQPPAPTDHGFQFVGSQRRFRQAPEEQGTALALAKLAPALDRFLNIGANAGYFSLLADRLGLDVIAFEPEPAAFRLLQRNLALNDCRALAIPAAVGDQWHRQSFFGTGTAGSLLRGLSGTPQWDRQRVTVIPLDQLGMPRTTPPPSMLWLLDCEGAEPLVLQGATATLQHFQPLLILEWQPRRDPELWAASVDLLLDLGFSHLLACSSLVTGEPLTDRLCTERLADGRFLDNVLIFSLPRHGDLVARLRAPHPPGG
ncbi:MAG: FkbM family methyltransferase [Cyanobacteriota bacterium]|nr:FkbM family methyltransferase [Cyanobacteriota bacterium]